MEGIIVKLTDGDITYMAAYYAKQAPMAGQKKMTLKDERKGSAFTKSARDITVVVRGSPWLAGQQAVIPLTPEQEKALSRFLSSLR